jgi:hypothetical protein
VQQLQLLHQQVCKQLNHHHCHWVVEFDHLQGSFDREQPALGTLRCVFGEKKAVYPSFGSNLCTFVEL